MKVVNSSVGMVDFYDGGSARGSISFTSESLKTLFLFGVALQNDSFGIRDLNFIRFGTTEKIKVANWIWCLLFEWHIEHSATSPFCLYFVPGHGSDPRHEWLYGSAIMRYNESKTDFSVPLGLLGRRAQASFSRQCKELSPNYREKFRRATPLRGFLDYLFIQELGHASSAPTWAVYNPYEAFPNFIPDSLNHWPTTFSDKDDSRSLSMKAWKLGRGEFGEEDEYSRRMDLAQWRQASIEREREQDSYDC